MTELGNASANSLQIRNAIGMGTDDPAYRIDVRGTAATDGIRTAMGLDLYPVPAPVFSNSDLALVESDGNLDIGTYYYHITYTTAIGETNANNAVAITTDADHRKVTVTLPVSDDLRVTGRKIYRTMVGEANYNTKLLATITDNITTVYLDDIADGSLGSDKGYYRSNTTCLGFSIGGTRSMTLPNPSGGDGNLFLGPNVGNITLSGGRNIGIGKTVLNSLTTGTNNIALGYYALSSVNSGGSNVALGFGALALGTGSNNIALGINAGYGITGDHSVHVGLLSGNSSGSGSYSVAVGAYANYNSTASAIHIGYRAGKYETADNKLYIDSIDRNTEANSRTSAPIYGVMSATPADQVLSLGGGGKVGINNIDPAFPLDAAGDINTTGSYRVNGTPLDVSHLTDATGLLDGTGWSNGITVPDNETGNDNDYYLNTATCDLYHKEDDAWVVVGNIRGATGVGITFLGEYVAATVYAVNDAVTYDGSLYVSLAGGNVGHQPDTSSSYWLLAVSKGDTGDIGSGTNFSGSIGIGTTDPAYRLDVRGTTAADGIRTAMGLDLYPVPAPVFSSSDLSLAAGGANLGVGTYYYHITYTTAVGETEISSSQSITTDADNRKVTVTLPCSDDPRVTGRRIYRTMVGGVNYSARLLTTIADNITTAYLDDIADGSLGTDVAYFRSNTTCFGISVAGSPALVLPNRSGSDGNLFLGLANGCSTINGGRNVGMGRNVLDAITSGSSNIGIGFSALSGITSGSGNIGIGYAALAHNATSSSSIGIGMDAGYGVIGNFSINIGAFSGFESGSGSYSVAIGSYTNYNATAYAIHIGDKAGRYETGPSTLIIDSYDRGSEANARVAAPIYGIMSSISANQKLSLGGGGKVGINNIDPAFPLDAAGDVNTTGSYRVNGTPLDVSHLTDTTGLLSSNNWSDGTAVPDNSSGRDGDYYLNTTTYDLYHKESGLWVMIGNLQSGGSGGLAAEDAVAYAIMLG
ncbi:MAG: hypothetical protein PHQ27_04285 [Victivallales bacterium]|nr:hypothetical protein [Victivallales bacterium]